MRDHLGRSPDDLRIDIGPRAVDRVEVEHDHAQGDTNMWCGDPDAGGGVHRVEQVGREIAQCAVERVHRLRRERKPRVGIADDGADGHDVL